MAHQVPLDIVAHDLSGANRPMKVVAAGAGHAGKEGVAARAGHAGEEVRRSAVALDILIADRRQAVMLRAGPAAAVRDGLLVRQAIHLLHR